MTERKAAVNRNTNETKITLSIDLDGTGQSTVETGIGFFDHMLTHLAKHSLCDLEVKCKGDLDVDGHHTVEDVGIAFGQALARAVGDKAGIFRYGDCILPMDESLVMVALDISGRGSLCYDVPIAKGSVGGFDCELAKEFFKAAATNAGINLHVRLLNGTNAHHIIEASFKSFARALRTAITKDQRFAGIPSTKGTL